MEASMQVDNVIKFADTSATLDDTLFVALELSRATWVVAVFASRLGERISLHAVPGGNMERLIELLQGSQAKMKEKGAQTIRTMSCYEAGYDGFWIYRALVARGIENHVLDGASIPVDR